MRWILVSLLLVNSLTFAQAGTDVMLLSPDKVELGATYFPPPTGSKAPAVLLLHEAERTREIWSPLAELLQRNGIAVLAIDLRGHGESVRRLTAQGPARVDAAAFTDRDYQDMLLDVNTAFDWLGTQTNIDSSRVAIIGSSLGANLALRYALFNENLAALVLLSPVMDYQGLKADEAMDKLGPIPFRIVVSSGDNVPFNTAKQLIVIRQKAGGKLDGKELIASTGTLRGTDLLRGVEGLTPVIVTWLAQQLRVTPPPAP